MEECKLRYISIKDKLSHISLNQNELELIFVGLNEPKFWFIFSITLKIFLVFYFPFFFNQNFFVLFHF